MEAGWCARKTFYTLEEMRTELAHLLLEIQQYVSLSEDSLFDLRLVVNELSINAVQYGSPPVCVTVSQCCTGDIHILIKQAATVEFCPSCYAQQAPTAQQTRGRGIFLAGKLSDAMAYSSQKDKVLVCFRGL